MCFCLRLSYDLSEKANRTVSLDRSRYIHHTQSTIGITNL